MEHSLPGAGTGDGDEEATRRLALLTDLERLAGTACAACRKQLCGHEALFSVALGCKNAPCCLPCLARGLNRAGTELREDLLDYVQDRDCFRQAWDVASDREGLPHGPRPACLWPEDGPFVPTSPRPAAEERALAFAVASTWDAGDMGCGDLVLALRGRLNALPAGAVLKVTARDPAAPEDLPAWCRLTGHRLLQASHPEYFIQRKEL